MARLSRVPHRRAPAAIRAPRSGAAQRHSLHGVAGSGRGPGRRTRPRGGDRGRRVLRGRAGSGPRPGGRSRAPPGPRPPAQRSRRAGQCPRPGLRRGGRGGLSPHMWGGGPGPGPGGGTTRGEPGLPPGQEKFTRQYIDAWNFLTLHTTRLCASACRRPETPRWRAPLVVLDVDGVLDKQIFGFPCTTAAGIRAVSLLHAHEVAVALNTARTVPEVKEYCRAYGFVGGVAEYGAAVWDAVNGRERVLVSDESLRQLDRARLALRTLPGVFVNDDYRYSLRAYTYERGTTVALPTMLIRNLLAGLGADRLDFHQTYLDTAVLAKETDKGRGLEALLALSGTDSYETIAVGDSEADLPMFRVARRSVAPSHISCRPAAVRLGCRIADGAFQPGLLGIVRSIGHSAGGRCDRCRSCDGWPPEGGHLFWTLLEAADQSRRRLLLRALVDPTVLQAFVK